MFAGKFSPMPEKVYDPSLVGWWLLNEGSGTKGFDSSGANHNGVFIGNPAWNRDSMEYCVELNGSSAVIIYENIASSLHTGSVSFWVKTSTTAGADFIGLVTAGPIWAIYSYNNHITFYDWNVWAIRESSYSINNNNWHHLVLTFVSRATNGSILYYDGQPVYTTTTGYGDLNVPPYYMSAPIGVSIGSDGPSSRFFTGKINDVRIYNRILSAAEVLTMYREKNRVMTLPTTEMFYGFPRKSSGDFS